MTLTIIKTKYHNTSSITAAVIVLTVGYFMTNIFVSYVLHAKTVTCAVKFVICCEVKSKILPFSPLCELNNLSSIRGKNIPSFPAACLLDLS